MTGAIALLLFAGLAGHVGPRQLRAARWVGRLPAWGTLAWLALSISIYTSLVLAGVSLAVPEIPAHDGLADLVHVCSQAFQAHLSTREGVLALLTGTGLVTVLVVRLAASVFRRQRRASVARSEHRSMLAFASHAHQDPDVSVLAHPTPVAYCLPGRHGHVVVSQGALSVLSEPQLQSVIVHERAHLKARHHLLRLAIDSLAAALGGHLGTAEARTAVADLLEMHADDAAAPWQRRHLAAALVLLAQPAHPAGTLAAGGRSTLARVRRLTADGASIRRRERVIPLAAIAIALTVPGLLVSASPLAAVLLDNCTLLV